MSAAITPVTPMTLLWAEDDDNDRLFIRRAISHVASGVNVVFAEDGALAWAYLCGLPPFEDRQRFPFPHIVVTDLKMPQCGGFDLIRRVRSEPHFAGLPVYVFSASDLQRDLHEAQSAGANGYVCKPAGLTAWQERVQDLILKARESRPAGQA